MFVTPPFPGHVFPVLPLVRELVSRGHRVSYVTSPALADQVKVAGAQVVELRSQPAQLSMLAQRS